MTETLENAPDGFLVKLRRIGESKFLKDGIAEMKLESLGSYSFGEEKSLATELFHIENLKERGFAIVKRLSFDLEKHDENELLPVVDGEIEVVEVKTGVGTLPPHQIVSYTDAVKNGFPLRFFKVDIVSFEQNQFEIKEKLITNPNEIKYRIVFD